ncbi:chemotaxis protein CheA [Solimonas sp. SE-A11]|uniref:chemotaxis protein CheA n=1 Tax=Solimonas sp. SE-A11 TaxID=3054954 RepID=UPI00259C8ACD|nr:chemotaxis protein CheA [Solimonas sp. SE-A11]MDM4770779.1 chemotaxis protein CheA [Solimonas sp. SE-A11]
MGTGVDDDIKRDFLQEAGELVQRLSEQLIDLEKSPDDPELLNAVFRAFHTVKGGAGFLELHPLVELCHVTEDVCNGLRSGQVKLDSTMMDCLLQSLDQVQLMLDSVAKDEALRAAPEDLVDALRTLAACAAAPAPQMVVAAPVAPAAAPARDMITDDEFEALLDQLQGKAPAVVAAVPAVEHPSPACGRGEGERVSVNVGGSSQASSTAPSPPAPLPQAGEGSKKEPAETQVRVDTQKLDRMMNLVGELVLVRNRLKSLQQRSSSDPVSRAVAELDFITRSLQGAVMQIRMQPIKRVFSRFPKLARDVARGLGKQIEVELQGEDTDLDKNLVEALADPLVHMVRNSVDHGIELPDVRQRAGKPAAGRLMLAAQQQGDHILITVRDDGAGIDPDRLRQKAVQKGLVDPAAAQQMTPEECLDLIFLPGFSTKEQISDLSGRGVGMDVVRSRIRELNGHVVIESKVGQGTCFRIRVPLTLAILSALMVHAGGRRYALPLSPVRDVFVLDETKVRKLDRWDVVMVRNEPLRLVYLDPWLQAAASDAPRHVAVVTVDEERYGFVVSEVRGREEVVIKPLGASLRGLSGVAGATVMPDGQVALILDLSGLVQAYRQSLISAQTAAPRPSNLENGHG